MSAPFPLFFLLCGLRSFALSFTIMGWGGHMPKGRSEPVAQAEEGATAVAMFDLHFGQVASTIVLCACYRSATDLCDANPLLWLHASRSFLCAHRLKDNDTISQIGGRRDASTTNTVGRPRREGTRYNMWPARECSDESAPLAPSTSKRTRGKRSNQSGSWKTQRRRVLQRRDQLGRNGMERGAAIK